MICTLALTLTACVQDHEHTFSPEWDKNETHHWHVCTGDLCLATDAKGEHEWDEGTVTDEATVYTCTVCAQTKTEALGGTEGDEEKNPNEEHENVIEDEEDWQNAIAEQKFDNVSIDYTYVLPDETQKHTVKIAGNLVYRAVEEVGSEGGVDDFTFSGEEALIQKTAFLDFFLALLADKNNYVYDPELGAFITPSKIEVVLDMGDGYTCLETVEDGEVKFDNLGNLIYFTCTLTEAYYEGDVAWNSTTGTITMSFYDYGTTVVEMPDDPMEEP